MKNIKTLLVKKLYSVDFGDEIYRDYYQGNIEGYKTDRTRFNKAQKEALLLLDRFQIITEAEIIEATGRAFSGRLEYNKEKQLLEYTAGQFYDLELPQAVLAVVEYIANVIRKGILTLK